MDKFTTIVLLTICCKEAVSCKFPAEWRGRWYQGLLGQVVIRDDVMTQKGVCIDQYKDYYLVQNKEENCNQCLLIMKRHRNVLQYKESFCMQGTLKDICRIRMEAVLYTLVREPAQPVRCPFEGAYNFAYSPGGGSSMCRAPPSRVQPCASEAKFNFRFKQCNDVYDSYDKSRTFECLATWKSGSETYIYGGFEGSGIVDKEDIYRCFMYKTLGNEVYLAMSADTSCRGPVSPTEGPLVMEFSRADKTDSSEWQTSSCRYPAWLGSKTWEDITGRHLYVVDRDWGTIRQQYRRKLAARPTVQAAFRCLRLTHLSPNEFVALTFSSHGCVSSRQCIRILKRHDHVLEFHQGIPTGDDIDGCGDEHVNNATRHIIVSDRKTTQPCPYPGSYAIEHSVLNCQGRFMVGCADNVTIGVESSCPSLPAVTIECVGSWEEQEKFFLLARRPDNEEGALANCFAFQKTGDYIAFATDPGCNMNAAHVYEEELRYTLKGPPVVCGIGSESEYGIVDDDPTRDRDRKKPDEPTSGQMSTHYSIGLFTLLKILTPVALSHWTQLSWR